MPKWLLGKPTFFNKVLAIINNYNDLLCAEDTKRKRQSLNMHAGLTSKQSLIWNRANNSHIFNVVKNKKCQPA